MAFSDTITDSKPFTQNILEAIEYGERWAAHNGEYHKRAEFKNLGNQIRDIYAAGGRG
jgi:hypothetical protein